MTALVNSQERVLYIAGYAVLFIVNIVQKSAGTLRRAAFDFDSFVAFAVTPAVTQKGFLLGVVARSRHNQGMLSVNECKIINLFFFNLQGIIIKSLVQFILFKLFKICTFFKIFYIHSKIMMIFVLRVFFCIADGFDKRKVFIF